MKRDEGAAFWAGVLLTLLALAVIAAGYACGPLVRAVLAAQPASGTPDHVDNGDGPVELSPDRLPIPPWETGPFWAA